MPGIRTPLIGRFGPTRIVPAGFLDLRLARQFTAANSESFVASSFDGVNLGAGDFSLECWFNRDSGGGNEVLCTKFGDTNNYWTLQLSASSFPAYNATIGGTLVHSLASASAITTPGWHQIVVVADRDNAGNCVAYLDGADDTAGGTLMTTADLDNAGSFYIGQRGNDTLFWNGGACRLRVYKGVLLSAANVTALYNGGRGRLHRGLPAGISASASWDLNESAGDARARIGNHGSDTFTVTSRSGPG